MPIEHAVIPDADLHEPKGVAGASANTVYIANGAGSGAWSNELADVMFPLTDTVWDDLRFPASAINPPGGLNDADVDSDDGTFLFAAGATEVVAVVAQMPHGWVEGTALVPHVHWCKTTSAAGDVVWQLEYRKYPIGGQGTTTWSVHSTIASTVGGTPDNDSAEESLISSFGDFDMTGNTLSDIIIFRITRLGPDGSDTYGADARLLEFDLHYQIDRIGSDNEFSHS